ncbi:MAG: hypothetical protein HDS84_00205 [Bacteroidales bacterium]|nr:hypothetical protein [Bacteroidales bacterium]
MPRLVDMSANVGTWRATSGRYWHFRVLITGRNIQTWDATSLHFGRNIQTWRHVPTFADEIFLSLTK